MIQLQFQTQTTLDLVLNSLNGAASIDEVAQQAGALLLNRIRTRFLQMVDPDGQPWVPSRAGLARQKAGTGQTLFDTGTLFHSIQFYQNSKDEYGIGTNVPYAPKLQLGQDGLVPRVFLGFSDDDAKVVEQLVQKRFEEAMKNAV